MPMMINSTKLISEIEEYSLKLIQEIENNPLFIREMEGQVTIPDQIIDNVMSVSLSTKMHISN